MSNREAFIIDEQYWREFAIKFARKRGIRNMEQLTDIAQDAITKIYSIDLTRLNSQKDFERFVGRAIANMIRDWQRKERPRTHAQLFEFTHFLNTTDRIEDIMCEYLDEIIPKGLTFNGGKKALVDSVDGKAFELFNWHLVDCGRKEYVRAKVKGKHIYLHRFIAKQALPKVALDGAPVNFINGNTLDCRRTNLAIGTTPLEVLL
jgi:hypothetical protein